MKKNLLIIVTVMWMALIFWFSAQPADESGHMSLSVGHVIGSIVIPDFEQMTEKEQDAFAEKIEYPVRKAAHASEYAVLGMLVMAVFGSYAVNGKKRMIRSLCVCAAYAASDEFHQIFVPGRSCQIGDVLIDSAGAFAGIVCFAAAAGWLKKRKIKKEV